MFVGFICSFVRHMEFDT